MKIIFVMPGYVWAPSGGYRVVCEHANRLASRGHQVTVVHPRRLKLPVIPEKLSAYRQARQAAERVRNVLAKPSIDWQPIDKRVKLLFVPSSDSRYIPDADAIFATAWGTVRPVLECPPTKGEKFYLIQHYETWQGPKDLVDATWRSPLHKVVISKWLLDLGKELGSGEMVYVPNAIDHGRYRLTRPIENRPRRVAMMFSTVPFKGSAYGIEALKIARERYPDLQAVFFGLNLLRPRIIPSWIEYHRNARQDFIINEIYNKSSIFLAPSLSEGWPLPPAEAACCGCALVATDIGGFREHIQNGVTGLLSPPKDPKALAENLCLLLENDGLRVRLATAGNTFIKRFNWERSTDLLEDFLIRVVQGKRREQQDVSAPIHLGINR